MQCWLALLPKHYRHVLDQILIPQFLQMLGPFVYGLKMNSSIFSKALSIIVEMKRIKIFPNKVINYHKKEQD
jgi:hypothetical protein